MKRVCGWCKKPMGEKPPINDKSETHGMCDSCEKAFDPTCSFCGVPNPSGKALCESCNAWVGE